MQPESRDRALRILIVEDEPDIREALAEALGEVGYQLVSVATIDQARAALAAAPYDLLLLDVYLDGATCDELLAEIADGDVRPATVLTSADPGRRSSDIAERFSLPLVLKPFDLDELIATIGRAHDERRVPLQA